MVMQRHTTDRIAAALDPRNEDGVIAALRSTGLEQLAFDLSDEEIAVILDETRSNRMRNAAAVALADRRADGAAARIAALMTSPVIAKASGTLLFALDEAGGDLPLEAFLNLIEHGSYESRAEALGFLADDRLGPADHDALAEAAERLEAVAEGSDAEAAEAASEALDHLRPQIGGPRP